MQLADKQKKVTHAHIQTPHDKRRTVRSNPRKETVLHWQPWSVDDVQGCLPPCLSLEARKDIQTVPRAMVSGHRREARRFASPSPGATGRGGDITATR